MPHDHDPWNEPPDDRQADFLNLLQGINTSSAKTAASLAQLVVIEQARLQNDLNLSHTMAIQADSLNTLLDLVNATLAAKSAEDQTVADLKAQVANDAAIQDPALQAKFDATMAALAAASPSPAVPPPVVDPNAPPTPAPTPAP
jgi:hypothetical protein